jgi:hypothetical protein
VNRNATAHGLLLALIAAAVVAAMAPDAALAMTGCSYGCSFCGHPSYPPWHYSHCRLYRGSTASSGGYGGGYSGGYGGGEALGRVVEKLLDRFLDGIHEGQRQAAALEAERRRQEALARERERQRQEQLRQERIRWANWLREDLDRREAEMSERLEGVFDPVGAAHPTPFFGIGGSGEPDLFADSSVVDLRPERSARRGLESRLRAGSYSSAPTAEPQLLSGRMDPAFLQAQARRAADTDAFATRNYGSVMPEDPARRQPWRFTFYLPPPPGMPVDWLGRVQDGLHDFAREYWRRMDLREAANAAVTSDHHVVEKYGRLYGELLDPLGRRLLGERQMTLREMWEARKNVLGAAAEASQPFWTTGLDLTRWSDLSGPTEIGLDVYGVWGAYEAASGTSKELEILTGVKLRSTE